MARARGTWILGAALLAFVALSVLAVHSWRERGAWLRTPPGKLHVCVEFEGNLSDSPLGPGTEISSLVGEPGNLPTWEFVHGTEATFFRRAFAQFAWKSGGAKELPELFPTMEVASMRGVGKCRFAWIDERGEVVRSDP